MTNHPPAGREGPGSARSPNGPTAPAQTRDGAAFPDNSLVAMKFLDIDLRSPFFSAPMAGVSSPAFRVMCAVGGAGLVYTEMVSARGLVENDPHSWRLLHLLPQEEPVAIQLFGADPDYMRRAVEMINHLPHVVLDLNMGCPARKIRRQGAGSALLDDPPLAGAVAAAAVAASRAPVTAKLRLGLSGWVLDQVAPRLVDAGVAALCLHPRTANQGYGGSADWSHIARLKEMVPVPVIGNGDVRSGRDGARLMALSGCDAVMIGRAALGDPWIFGRGADRLAGREPAPITLDQRREMLMTHMALAREQGGPGHALHFVRQFMMWYSKGLPGAVGFRREAGAETSLDALLELCHRFFDQLAQREMAA